ncbi:MAG: 1-phosphofructokinase family hexose kinase [Methylococcales bacterium]|nr:1-phosphofructokinase family hexose kinase [Methylococcales bacterium]
MNPSATNQLAIVSLSLNPAIDLTYQTQSLKHEQKSRATQTSYDPGGTGINVGRALEILKANSHTCYISAGKMGEFLEFMLNQQLNNIHPLKINGETRINTTILQQSPKHQYQINALGPVVTSKQFDEIIEKFLTLCGQGIGILTGSLPAKLANTSYQKINIALKKQGARAIIDAPSAVLKHANDSQPFLIKPNLHELEILQNKSLSQIEDIAVEARSIVQKGTQYVCVSLAERGAILTTPDNSYYCPSPSIEVCSTVGAGDSMVAGLAYAFAQQQSPEQALKLAIACGAGTAKQAGTQLFKQEDIEPLLAKTNIKTLAI